VAYKDEDLENNSIFIVGGWAGLQEPCSRLNVSMHLLI